MKFLLGTKEKMTQIYDENGVVTPATKLSVGDLSVTQVKTKEKDGYSAIQIGFGERRAQNVAKPQRTKGSFRYMKEQRVDDESKYAIGDTLAFGDMFEEGDTITVSAVSKGKGFQGVVKRHGFHGGPRTHGQKHSERAPGSIGAGGVQRVLKGLRMAGRMGGDRTTVSNLTVVKVDKKDNALYVKGAVPGRTGALVEIVGDES